MNHEIRQTPAKIIEKERKPPVRLGDFVSQVDQEIPLALAEPWDHVGLLLGDPDAILTGIVLTLDVTEQTLELADTFQANLIVSHHPLIFAPLQTLRADIPEQNLIRKLIKKEMAVLALLTNLDAVRGGTADCLADALQLPERARTVFLPLSADPALSEDRDPVPGTVCGHGRLLDLAEPVDSRKLRSLIQNRLGSSGVRQNSDTVALLRRLAVSPGRLTRAGWTVWPQWKSTRS